MRRLLRLLGLFVALGMLATAIWGIRPYLTLNSTSPAATGLVGDARQFPLAVVRIPGGRQTLGHLSRETPLHEVQLVEFWLEPHEVTNQQFAQFVSATLYHTTAEQNGAGNVFDVTTHTWRVVKGATWQHPSGPYSSIETLSASPVVQVSWHDALAYCQWSGQRLPTEAEWEFAARGGLHDADFPWGTEETISGQYQANYWQGWFPERDFGHDRFRALAPVASFPANSFGLYDMAGNAREWCQDWYAADGYERMPVESPTGPSAGAERVIRGGSWLSAINTPGGIRVWERSSAAPDYSANDLGFRCVGPLKDSTPAAKTPPTE